MLILPPRWLLEKADQNKSEPIQQNVIVIESKTPEPTPTDIRLYQEIIVSREALKSYLEVAFTQYGISEKIPLAEDIIFCESGWNIQSNNGISFGIFQFTRPTWSRLGYGDIMNPQSQIQVAAKMFSLGMEDQWDCFCFNNRDNKKCQLRGF